MKCLSTLILICASLSLVGCSTTEEDLCDAKCDCEYCSDREYDTCVSNYDHEYRDADYEGCLDLYDEWIDCQDSTWWCSGGHFETSCGHEKNRLKDCTDR